MLPQCTTHKLVIPSVQRLDSANYTCIAKNPVGSVKSIDTSFDECLNFTSYQSPLLHTLVMVMEPGLLAMHRPGPTLAGAGTIAVYCMQMRNG